MIEKVRVSLWDIFTFFMTGVLASVSLIGLLISLGYLDGSALTLDNISKIPTTFIIVVAPILLTLSGLIIEPIANYFERYLGNILFFWLKLFGKRNEEVPNVLEEYIKSEGLGYLSGKINNPFALCKEYVETKQLSTTFMVFLSRYGFYRNCCLITLITGVCYFSMSKGVSAWAVLILTYLLSAIFKKRADEFYSYQAPSVYSAFLIDNLNWPSKVDSQEK